MHHVRNKTAKMWGKNTPWLEHSWESPETPRNLPKLRFCNTPHSKAQTTTTSTKGRNRVAPSHKTTSRHGGRSSHSSCAKKELTEVPTRTLLRCQSNISRNRPREARSWPRQARRRASRRPSTKDRARPVASTAMPPKGSKPYKPSYKPPPTDTRPASPRSGEPPTKSEATPTRHNNDCLHSRHQAPRRSTTSTMNLKPMSKAEHPKPHTQLRTVPTNHATAPSRMINPSKPRRPKPHAARSRRSKTSCTTPTNQRPTTTHQNTSWTEQAHPQEIKEPMANNCPSHRAPHP